MIPDRIHRARTESIDPGLNPGLALHRTGLNLGPALHDAGLKLTPPGSPYFGPATRETAGDPAILPPWLGMPLPPPHPRLGPRTAGGNADSKHYLDASYQSSLSRKGCACSRQLCFFSLFLQSLIMYHTNKSLLKVAPNPPSHVFAYYYYHIPPSDIYQ